MNSCGMQKTHLENFILPEGVKHLISMIDVKVRKYCKIS
jgi:hypothetical protein